ncbi:hypothetical protein HYH03_002853 [Edaphochlamys debaryana]|uniref:Pyrroline-5-carboxylate reductase catalytic N-terminal domain-containing protein n=1 Tax=Edaphochlamys debaryana TaxID=47281 RepID=A0A835YAB5_9CHLO|nr:hypothetical protein HYH03_002853 [Edaphochlamys debaryana]|eukprot:KAG2499275.1 hypothetical protein HYH03_002853 [Edaphochlamys debaryana]
MTVKVSIVGAGNVGKALGSALTRGKVPVVFGVRDAAKYADLAKLPHTSVASVADAIKSTDVVIVAVSGAQDDAGIKAIAASLGPEVAGKLVLDATNPLGAWPGLETRWKEGTSAGEVMAAALPNSVVYKAFNTVPAEQMADAASFIPGLPHPTLMFAGGPERQDEVEAVIKAAGYDPQYVGPIRYARNLESLAELYVHLGVPGAGTSAKWGRNFHWQVVRKTE